MLEQRTSAGEDADATISDAAAAAAYGSSVHGVQFRTSDILAMVSTGLILARSGSRYSARDIAEFGALVDWIFDAKAGPDLLAIAGHRSALDPSIGLPKTGTMVFTIDADLQVAIPAHSYRAFEVQLFLLAYRAAMAKDQVPPHAIEGLDLGDVVFRSTTPGIIQIATAIWRRIISMEDIPGESDRRTTASIYGVKTRLIPLVTAVIRSSTPDGASICDLMSGSGIVSRTLARTHRVLSNDANVYGRVFAAASPIALIRAVECGLIPRLRERTAANIEALKPILASHLDDEAALLTSASNESTILAYRRFCEAVPTFFGPAPDLKTTTDDGGRLEHLVLPRRSAPELFPYVLATSSWANVHFGLRQCIVLDSIRYAISREGDPALRTTLLAALLQVALSCASGPHFAQPLKPKGPAQYKALIEKRSRPVDAEFFATLTSFMKVAPPAYSRLGALQGDWRSGLDAYCSILRDTKSQGVVYIDPPYTSVQYSRYYHVLNVLADYDYPECEGPGRCPVRSYRFSSRFEYKIPQASKEMHELIKACSARNLDIFISYSRSGAIAAVEIVDTLEKYYGLVRVFQMAVRHHTQGRTASRDRMETTEYLFVARGSLNSRRSSNEQIDRHERNEVQ